MSLAWSIRSSARVAPLFLAALLACSDDEGEPQRDLDAAAPLDATSPDGGTSADGAAPLPPGTDPLYIVHSATQTPEGTRTNFFTVTSSLTTPAKLDYARSVTQPGRSRLYAQRDLGFFAIGAGESLTITRYTLGEDDSIVPGTSLSLQPQGVTSLDAQAVYFVSATKAFYKDAANAQVVVWNPSAMTVEQTLKLPADLIKQGYETSFSQWAGSEGSVFFAVGWTTETYDKVLSGTRLVRIDTATNEVTVGAEETRCRGLGRARNVSGTLYFFSDVINAFGQAVYPNDGGQPSCALRINPGQTTFDPAYVGDVASAFRADQAATVIDVTADGTAWVQVADLNVTPRTPGTTYSQWYDQGWSWYRLPLATLQNPTAVTTTPGAYSAQTATAEDEFLITQADMNYSLSTLTALSSGTPTPGVSFDGFALDVARLR